ncbi:hypothetical protein M0C34_19350 [Agarivorans sp. TSD2052]|uniref:hypothetical protein n=1 Tax=Agarivorans sp. TSD2052 TaxID=2937286 RepID=UPI00200F1E70|nr:hypothetical protein [Agarivorans sp. TSD2052]UPW18354.1 hypothetical protein M0C34_19350 [Agarivorans sp. TSD2052]
MTSINKSTVCLSLLFAISACNTNKQLTDQDYPLYTSYSIENLTNYPLSLNSSLNPQLAPLSIEQFQGTIAPGERRNILELVDMSQASNPPSTSFKQLNVKANLGEGMRTVYQQIDDQDWQYTLPANSKENYLLRLADADLAL